MKWFAVISFHRGKMNKRLLLGVGTLLLLQASEIPLFILHLDGKWELLTHSVSRLPSHWLSKRTGSVSSFPTVKGTFLVFHVDISKTNLSPWLSGSLPPLEWESQSNKRTKGLPCNHL